MSCAITGTPDVGKGARADGTTVQRGRRGLARSASKRLHRLQPGGLSGGQPARRYSLISLATACRRSIRAACKGMTFASRGGELVPALVRPMGVEVTGADRSIQVRARAAQWAAAAHVLQSWMCFMRHRFGRRCLSRRGCPQRPGAVGLGEYRNCDSLIRAILLVGW
jgi:hypothetical protein